MEVTAALSSSDTNIVNNMKETMRKFQTFLANFEVMQIFLCIWQIPVSCKQLLASSQLLVVSSFC